MRDKELCNMCTEYSIDIKCDHKKDCKLLGILRENRKLREELRETKKKLSDLEFRKSWDDFPDMMGR